MYDPTIGRWSAVDAMSEKYFGFSPYNYTLNNPVNLIDLDGNEVEELEDRTRYTGDDMVNLLRNLQGSSQSNNENSINDEPPIDFFGAGENKGSRFHKVPDLFPFKKGDNKFYLFAHGNSRKVIFVDSKDKNNVEVLDTPEKIYNKLMEESPEWQAAMKKNKDVTLTFFSCNTGSNLYLQHETNEIIKNPNPIAQKFSKKYPNVTVVAPEGYVNFGETTIKGLENKATNPTYKVFKNGKIIKSLDKL
jgi:hypothetical protein